MLPRTRNGYDSITTWVDYLSRRVKFISLKENDTAFDVENNFFRIFSSVMGCRIVSYRIEILRLFLNSGID